MKARKKKKLQKRVRSWKKRKKKLKNRNYTAVRKKKKFARGDKAKRSSRFIKVNQGTVDSGRNLENY